MYLQLNSTLKTWIYQVVLCNFLLLANPISNQLRANCCLLLWYNANTLVTSIDGWCILNDNLSSQSNDVIAVHGTVFWKYIVQYTIAENTILHCIFIYNILSLQSGVLIFWFHTKILNSGSHDLALLSLYIFWGKCVYFSI